MTQNLPVLYKQICQSKGLQVTKTKIQKS